MKVLVACEFSGVVRDAFSEMGHDAISCDILETERPGKHHTGDIIEYLDIMDDTPDLMIAHPPCTHLSVSGARWFPAKRADGRQQAAVDFFMKMIDAPIEKICVENPICIMSSIYRKPDQIVQPWMFGHGETKATCLWLKGLPLLEPTDIVDGRAHKVHKCPPGPDRWRIRSRTYEGIAKAMAEQWSE